LSLNTERAKPQGEDTEELDDEEEEDEEEEDEEDEDEEDEDEEDGDEEDEEQVDEFEFDWFVLFDDSLECCWLRIVMIRGGRPRGRITTPITGGKVRR